ncbi:MAG: hypothetical protein K9N46_08830 [Candidatus Marinimicrobia bacterium]|nr:hypothetical protein [Candidatus Neomarinimicrobiota bacterium]MCF7830211.1 hypothetical protein [Candidatus Neomarinimicrobiota bacterium]MCF7880828.1 hypothetical protein [Candidatus Neomarinimicrobiota bacterium]
MKMSLKYSFRFIIMVLIGLLLGGCDSQPENIPNIPPGQNWTNYVRIAGHGLSIERVDDIIDRATETYVFGVETDNSLTGYYESFLNPEEKLKAMEVMAEAAHKVGNKVFIYTEGLETITANADQKEHTFFKDHPDWVQRNIEGEPAVFGGGSAFWIDEGDEDVWITPYAAEWREMFMERIRQIAATGMDGVFVDIPYWMTHFRGWGDTWASFDEYTVAAFKKETGLDAKKDLKLGDFNDPNFIKWVDFRIRTLTEFMNEVAENGRSVNPDFITIAEIYPGIEEAAVLVGADVYEMYQVVDVVAHEYSAGGYKSADRNPADWFAFMTGMYTFRAFAEEKASWMLTYSWEDHKKITPEQAMENLMMSQLMAGTNCWDAANHVMSGSNDYEVRKRIFKWINEHDGPFYLPRKPIKPVGVYFSQKTRNYFVDEFIPSYRGMMYMLMQSHQEFQIVTPRTLENFGGEVLILPDVKCLNETELNQLKKFVNAGKSLIVTGESGAYDYRRQLRPENPLHKMLGIEDTRKFTKSVSGKKFVYFPGHPGKAYFDSIEEEFNEKAFAGESADTEFNMLRNDFVRVITEDLQFQPRVEVSASPFVSTQIAAVDGNPTVFIANFKGLKAKENAVQISEENVEIRFPVDAGSTVYLLPYLGEKKQIDAQKENGALTVTIPRIDKGAVVWVE